MQIEPETIRGVWYPNCSPIEPNTNADDAAAM